MAALTDIIARSAWQPIETAPKDGRIVLAPWDGTVVYVGYVADIPVKEDVARGFWPFTWKERKVVGYESGWRVLTWSPRLGWGVNGNCAPFQPTHWQPLPSPPA